MQPVRSWVVWGRREGGRGEEDKKKTAKQWNEYICQRKRTEKWGTNQKVPRNEDTGIYNTIFRSVGVLVCWRFLTSKSTSKVIPATACWTRTVKNCSTEANTLPAHTRTWHRHMHDSCTHYMHTNHLLVTKDLLIFTSKWILKSKLWAGLDGFGAFS